MVDKGILKFLPRDMIPCAKLWHPDPFRETQKTAETRKKYHHAFTDPVVTNTISGIQGIR